MLNSAGPRWKGKFWLVSLTVSILQYGPLRRTVQELISANCLFNSIHKLNSFFSLTGKKVYLYLRFEDNFSQNLTLWQPIRHIARWNVSKYLIELACSIREQMAKYLSRAFFFFFLYFIKRACDSIHELANKGKQKNCLPLQNSGIAFECDRWNPTKMLSTIKLYFSNPTEEAELHQRFGVSKRIVIYFPTCDPFNRIWPIFPSLPHFWKCHPFFQVWSIFPSVTHSRCDSFF